MHRAPSYIRPGKHRRAHHTPHLPIRPFAPIQPPSQIYPLSVPVSEILSRRHSLPRHRRLPRRRGGSPQLHTRTPHPRPRGHPPLPFRSPFAVHITLVAACVTDSLVAITIPLIFLLVTLLFLLTPLTPPNLSRYDPLPAPASLRLSPSGLSLTGGSSTLTRLPCRILHLTDSTVPRLPGTLPSPVTLRSSLSSVAVHLQLLPCISFAPCINVLPAFPILYPVFTSFAYAIRHFFDRDTLQCKQCPLGN